MHCVKMTALLAMAAIAVSFGNFASAAEPDAERAAFRLLEHQSVFGGALTGSKVFLGKLPDHRAAICEGRAMDKPEEIASETQLAAAIESKVLVGRIAKQVDFETEKLVLIAWKGHAAQRLNARVDGAGEAQTIVFSESDTRTDAAKLAQSHVYFYVVDKDVNWKFEKERELPQPFPPPGPNRPQAN